MQDELEQKLRRQIQKNRIIWAVVTLAGLIITIVFTILRENSRQVEIIGPPDFFLSYKKVTYNNNFAFGILSGVLIGMYGLALLAGSLFNRFETTSAGQDTITVYRGMLHSILYINGEERDRIAPFSYKYFMEAPLSNGSTVTVALSRFYRFRITFSNGQKPEEF